MYKVKINTIQVVKSYHFGPSQIIKLGIGVSATKGDPASKLWLAHSCCMCNRMFALHEKGLRINLCWKLYLNCINEEKFSISHNVFN